MHGLLEVWSECKCEKQSNNYIEQKDTNGKQTTCCQNHADPTSSRLNCQNNQSVLVVYCLSCSISYLRVLRYSHTISVTTTVFPLIAFQPLSIVFSRSKSAKIGPRLAALMRSTKGSIVHFMEYGYSTLGCRRCNVYSTLPSPSFDLWNVSLFCCTFEFGGKCTKKVFWLRVPRVFSKKCQQLHLCVSKPTFDKCLIWAQILHYLFLDPTKALVVLIVFRAYSLSFRNCFCICGHVYYLIRKIML